MASNKNHVAYGLSFPNQTAMELWQNETNGQTPEDRHIGKTVRVLDTNREFMLIQHDPALIFEPLDAPAPLLADLDLYIDDAGGNDVTGDGSSGNPYKTFDRALQVLGNKIINKIVKIRPAAGVYTDWPEYFNPKYDVGGQIVIDASGEAYPQVAGPFTIGSIAGVGPADPFGDELATELTPTPAPSWTADQFYGKAMHFLTGAYANRILPIWKNTTAAITTQLDLFGFSNGDTFDIVDYPVKIQLDHPMKIKADTVGEQLLDFTHPHFVTAGIHFEINTGDLLKVPMFLHGVSAVMTYTKLVDMYSTDKFGVPLILRDSKINFDFVEPGTFDNSELEVWFNQDFAIHSLAGTPPAESGVDVVVIDSKFGDGLAKTSCRRSVFHAGESLQLLYCFIGGLTNSFSPGGFSTITCSSLLQVVFVEQIGYDDIVFNLSNQRLDCFECYIHKSGRPILLTDNSYFLAEWLHGGTINQAYALLIGRGSKFHIPDIADMTLTGTSGAIEWEFDGATVSAWPAAGNFVEKVDSFVSTKT
jgi:hypothetical protein